jgi:hypothetical protein
MVGWLLTDTTLLEIDMLPKTTDSQQQQEAETVALEEEHLRK